MWGSFALIRNYRLAWIKSSNTDTAFKHWCLVDQFLPSSTDPLHVELRATSHTHTWETESPWPVHFKHSHWWKRRSRSNLASHYAWGTNGVRECKMDVKSTWIPTWHRMDHVSCFMVKWTIFKNHILEVGLTQNHDTMTLWNLTIVKLSHFIMCEDPTWIKTHWNSVWLRDRSHVTSHYTWGFVTTLHDFGGVLGQPLDTFFWALMVMALGLCVKRP